MVNLRETFVKYKDMNAPAKAAAWYAVCNILQHGIAFFVVPVYTRLLTTAEYGQYAVFQSWREILIIFATLNLYCGVFTKAMIDYDSDRDRYTSSMQGLSTVITGVLLLFYVFLPNLWQYCLDMDIVTVCLLFCYFVFYPALTFWSVRQRVEYKYKMLIFVTVLIALLTPGLSIWLLCCTTLRAKAVIWGFLVIQICFGTFFYIVNFIRGKCFYHKDYWIHALKFNIPLIPHYLSLIVLGQSNRIMIKHYCGEDKAGIYSLAYSVSLLMNIIISAINGSKVPWLYEQMKYRNYELIATVSNWLCVLIGVMVFGTTLISPEIVRFLGTKEYMAAIWIIPPTAFSVYLAFCYDYFATVEFYYNKTVYVMVASVTGACMNILLNIVFLPRYGFLAAGYTSLLCYLLFMIMHFVFMRDVCRKNIGSSLVYDTRFIFISVLFLFAVMMFCQLLYRGYFLRYTIAILWFFIIYYKKNKIISIINQIK